MSLPRPRGEEGLSVPDPIATWILSPATTRKVDADAIQRDYPRVDVKSGGVAYAQVI